MSLKDRYCAQLSSPMRRLDSRTIPADDYFYAITNSHDEHFYVVKVNTNTYLRHAITMMILENAVPADNAATARTIMSEVSFSLTPASFATYATSAARRRYNAERHAPAFNAQQRMIYKYVVE